MMHDSDDPAMMHLLEIALSTLPHIEGNAIIADESGIHWKTIRRTAELVKYVADHSPSSQGTFNFTATAMLKPLGPFFPGSYHTGPGKQFAIGFQGANVVQNVFAKDKGNADAAIKDLTAALTLSTPKSPKPSATRSPPPPAGPTPASIPPPHPEETSLSAPPSRPSPEQSSAPAEPSPPPASSPPPSKPSPSNRPATRA